MPKMYTQLKWRGMNDSISHEGCKTVTLWGISLTKAEVKKDKPGFPGGAVIENLPANAGDTGSCPGLGRSHMPQSD